MICTTLAGIAKRPVYFNRHRIEGIGISCNDSTKYMVLVNDTVHELKAYYRPEKTLDDHMGNTPCGEYVNIPLPDGSKKRAYLY